MIIKLETQDRQGNSIEIDDIFERLYWDLSIKQLNEQLRLIESVFGSDKNHEWLKNDLKNQVQTVINQRQFMKENYPLRKALTF